VRSAIAAAAALLTAGACLADDIKAVTRPSSDVMLAFVNPGQIKKVLVEEGQSVTVGQELVLQDDDADREQLDQLKAEAETRVRILAAESQLQQKKVDLMRLEGAGKAASTLEVEHARLDVIIANL
jgi:multidrug efflux pump subunit AcrA (membrane-fusion protein)